MNETLVYCSAIILLPIIPSLILYLAIPRQQSQVEGTYQGLNIKLKGAFGSYFILTIMLTTFIVQRDYTEHKYEYWTIEGQIDNEGIGDPRQVNFSIQPPVKQISMDGRFIIENVPIFKGDNQRSTLNLHIVRNGKVRSNVVHLEQKSTLPFNAHELVFGDDHVTIKNPITLELAASMNEENRSANSYNPTSATVPVRVEDSQ